MPTRASLPVLVFVTETEPKTDYFSVPKYDYDWTTALILIIATEKLKGFDSVNFFLLVLKVSLKVKKDYDGSPVTFFQIWLFFECLNKYNQI